MMKGEYESDIGKGRECGLPQGKRRGQEWLGGGGGWGSNNVLISI